MTESDDFFVELRDQFAIAVVPAFLAAALEVDGEKPRILVDDIAADAYAMADALLKARAK